MRLSFIGISTLLVTLWTGAVIAEKTSTGNGFNPALFGALPACGSLCLHQVSANYGCDTNTTCVCTDDDLLPKLESCFTAMCPTIQTAISAKVHNLACDAPIRNRGGVVTIVVVVLFVLETIMIVLRVLARAPCIGGPGYGSDDYTAIFCYVISVVMMGLHFCLTAAGGGQDYFNLTIPKVISFLFFFYVSAIFYIPAVFISKASMVLLYLRTWSSHGQWTLFRIICWITIGCVVASTITSFFVAIFYCHPIKIAWSLDLEARKHQCLNLENHAFAIAAVSIFLDIVVLMLPISKLTELPIGDRQKIGLCAVFMAGVVVTALAIVRLNYISAISPDILNVTYKSSIIGLWTMAEVHLSVACICMPAATGFLRRLWSSGLSTMARSQGSQSDDTQVMTRGSSKMGFLESDSDGRALSP